MDRERVGMKVYDELYRGMSVSLAELDQERADGAGFSREIGLVCVKIVALREAMDDGFSDTEEEITFFRWEWPRFYAKLFFYQLAHRFEMLRGVLPGGKLGASVRREELRVAAWYRQHREFWAYYSSGSGVIDGQFTRGYSRGCILDPFCMVIDWEGATLASWRAAWGLAYEHYFVYLRGVREERRRSGGDRYEWKETRSAAVEWIKSMAEAGSVHINGKPATAMQLRQDFEERYGMELKDFDSLLYATDLRKLEVTPYLNKLMQAFVGRRERLGK